ncbi:tyrosine-type recombinase/integrase [Shouchella patagoniensis]|uniref:tyrosine-type recombinase/integrase n=1 Tax=Shouchella patagoniensis TaxID=228576 RepID=UPI000994FFDF|nr:tyrosine-type recombinase/integrase [Shouchella patagoniensis]
MQINHRKLPRLKKIKKNTDLEYLIEEFIIDKKVRNVSQNTLAKYKNNLKVLTEFLDVTNLPRDVSELTMTNMKAFIIYMLESHTHGRNNPFASKNKKVGLSPSYADDVRKNVNNFIDFLVSKHYGEELKLAKMRSIKYTENDIEILSIDELNKLFCEVDRSNFPDFRNYVLMTFLLDSMCRINEALTAKLHSVDTQNGFFTIRAGNSKNALPRVIPLQERTIHLIKKMNKLTATFQSDHLFLTDYGTPLPPEHFRKQLKRYALRSGIKKNVYPHLFRHTAATHFLENGGDTRHLQMILGHKDLRMIEKYTHLTSKGIAKNISEYTAVNKIKF